MAAGKGFGGGDGPLLDKLVVKIECDISGLQRGIAQAVAEIRTLKGALTAQVGGIALGDAMTAALVTPLIVATARIGQMRNELRQLTSEMRRALPAGAAGGGAAGMLGGAAGGMLIEGRRATGVDGRPVVGRGANGRFNRAWEADLSGGSPGLGALAGGIIGGATGRARVGEIFDEDDANRRADEAAEAGPRGRRRRGFFERMFSPSHAQRRFQVGRREFPGFAGAADDIGLAANTTGRAVRGAMGGRMAAALGLTGLGAVLSSLVPLAGALATVIGGTLAGAFAALMTPLGLAVAAFTALAAIWVSANWDNFKEFAEWFGERGKTLLGEGWADIVSGWSDFGQAVGELVDLVKSAFSDDSGALTGALKVFGEIALRVLNAAGEALGALGHVFAEVIRAITALLQGDFEGALQHAASAVAQFVTGTKETLFSLLPETRELWTEIDRITREVFGGTVEWVRGAVQSVGDFFQQLWDRVVGHSYVPDMVEGIAAWFSRLDDVMVRPAQEAAGAVAEVFSSLSDHVGGALENALLGGRFSLKDIGRGVVSDLARGAASRATRGAMSVIDPALSFGAKVASSFFGGFFADGGHLPAGTWGVVGERGPEIAWGGRDGLNIRPANQNTPGQRVHITYDLRGAEGDMAIDRKIARANANLVQQLNADAPARMQRFEALGT